MVIPSAAIAARAALSCANASHKTSKPRKRCAFSEPRFQAIGANSRHSSLAPGDNERGGFGPTRFLGFIIQSPKKSFLKKVQTGKKICECATVRLSAQGHGLFEPLPLASQWRGVDRFDAAVATKLIALS